MSEKSNKINKNNSESRVTDLANELNVSKDSLGSVISDKFIGKSDRIEILKILVKYDIDVLKYIKRCMKKKTNKHNSYSGMIYYYHYYIIIIIIYYYHY
jgi:hypothetical protein